MRIIAGKYKSRVIQIPRSIKVRPMQDRVKESIFNILGKNCIGAKVLDLFSGSGSLGMEALSRGAAEVTFIDNNRTCIETIRKNLKTINIEKNVSVIRSDALKAIKRFGAEKESFDLIFLDPPYYMGLIEKALLAIDRYGIMNDSSVVIAHYFKKEIVPESIGRIRLMRQNLYGDKIISFYNMFKNKELEK